MVGWHGSLSPAPLGDLEAKALGGASLRCCALHRGWTGLDAAAGLAPPQLSGMVRAGRGGETHGETL